MATKVIEYGANRTLHIRLSDKHWSVLFDMTSMIGQTPEEYCKEAIENDIRLSLDEPEYFGQLLAKGWKETLEETGKK